MRGVVVRVRVPIKRKAKGKDLIQDREIKNIEKGIVVMKEIRAMITEIMIETEIDIEIVKEIMIEEDMGEIVIVNKDTIEIVIEVEENMANEEVEETEDSQSRKIPTSRKGVRSKEFGYKTLKELNKCTTSLRSR